MKQINLHFDGQVTDEGIHVVDQYVGSETHLFFDYARFCLTQEVAAVFLQSLCDHILWVREAGRMIGVPVRQLEVHDSSKFSLAEFPYYARNFHGDKGDVDGFVGAWLHHIHQNPHHWQHWIFPDGYAPKGSQVEAGCVEMPYHEAREMIADWMGASFVYTGSWDMADWLHKNIPKIRVHSKTAAFLRQELDMLGYADVICQPFAQERTTP